MSIPSWLKSRTRLLSGWPNKSIAAFNQVTWSELLRQRGASAGYVALQLAQTGWEWDSGLDFFPRR